MSEWTDFLDEYPGLRCKALTKRGRQCGNPVETKDSLCLFHWRRQR